MDEQMDVFKKATELGELIKQHDVTKRMHLAELAVNGDFSLQEKIRGFNEKRDRMMDFMNKGIDDKVMVEALNKEIKTTYDEIMAFPAMKEYNEAQEQFSKLMKQVNDVLSFCITGEKVSSCGSDCANCSGCH